MTAYGYHTPLGCKISNILQKKKLFANFFSTLHLCRKYTVP